MARATGYPPGGKIEYMSQADKKLNQLTTTRFFAALSVVLYHGGHELGFLGLFPMLTSGPTAVNYFFVLSGFVLTLAYYRPDAGFDFRKYLIARFSRIYPVYILSFVLTCVYYIDIISKIKSEKILANIFLYQAWIPRYALSFNIAAWSLSVEVFFYLAFPFLLFCVKRLSVKQVAWISLGFWAVSQTLHAILFSTLIPEQINLLNYLPLFHLNSFLLGLAGGVWYLADSTRRTPNQFINRFTLMGSIGFVLLAISLREYMPSLFRGFSLDAGLLAPFFLIIILALALDTTSLLQRLKHPWLVLLGDSSYALFILHIPLFWLFTLLLKWTGTTIINSAKFSIHVLVSIFISILVFNYMERPVRDWLRANAQTLPFMLLDVILIFITIRLGFVLRLGDEVEYFLRTQNFAIRAGMAAYFIFLLAFRFYTTTSPRSLVLATLSGTAVLAGLMYLAWISKWVEGFPRSIILLIPMLIFTFLYISRLLVHVLRLKLLKTTH